MKIGPTGGILQSIVCSGPLLFWPSIYCIANTIQLLHETFGDAAELFLFQKCGETADERLDNDGKYLIEKKMR